MCPERVRYDRIIPDVHISVLCTRDWILHVGKDSHCPFLVLSTQPTRSLPLPRHPGSGLNRQHLITIPGVRYYPYSFTCFWTTGAGESSISHPLSPSLSRWVPFGASPPLNHQCSGWASQSQSYSFLSVLPSRGLIFPFHHLFPIPLFAALMPLFVTRVTEGFPPPS